MTASGGTAPAYALSQPFTVGLYGVSPSVFGIASNWSGIQQHSATRAPGPPVGSAYPGGTFCYGTWSVGGGTLSLTVPCGSNPSLYLLEGPQGPGTRIFLAN